MLEAQHKAILITKAMDILGNIINVQMTKPPVNKMRDIEHDYLERLERLERRLPPKEPDREQQQPHREPPSELQQLEKKPESACLKCSRDHISTTSAALNEAVRFVRRGGIKHPEAIRRFGIAIDELNIMERIDLAPERIELLSPKEKEIAHWVLDKGRELRHDISEMKTEDDLEKLAAKASGIRDEYLRKLFDITGADIEKIIDEVCKEVDDADKGECEAAIREFWEGQKKSQNA